MRKIFLPMILLFIISSGLLLTTLNSVSAADNVVEDSWNTKAPMNYPRQNFGVVAYEGKIYAIGGDQLSPGVSTTRVAFNERYDPKTNKWVTLESMPTPNSGFKAVAYDGKIYCIGRESTQVYDIAANRWSTKTPYPSSKAAPLGVHVVNGKIFVILTSSNPSVGCEMYLYDPNADSWVAKNNLPADSLIMVSFVMDNKLMVVGGFIDPVCAKILTYDTNIDKWSEERIISKPFISPVGVTSGLYAPQKIYQFYTMNFTSATSPYTAVCDPVSDTWVNGTCVPTARMGPGVVVVDDLLYVIGGLYQGGSLSVNEQYVPFGYHGTLPSGSLFSLDNIDFVDVLVVVVVVVVVVMLLLFFFKKRGKQVKANSGGDSVSSSALL